MPSLAEIGERIGIPHLDLVELIELPIVGEAIQAAGENPNWTAKTIWKRVGRPTLYTDSGGLNVDPLYVELRKRRELATRSDGRVNLERLVQAGPITAGRLRRTEDISQRRLEVIMEVDRLLRDHAFEPASMQRAKNFLGVELEKAKGAGEL